MRRYKIKLHHKHDCDYYTVVQEYFGLGCVNLIRCSNIEWRLSTGCYGSDYFDVAYPGEQEKARSVVTGYKNFAKFVLKFKTSEMVLRTKECLIISKVNHNYFIVGGFRMGNVMQNELTDYVSEHVINCMKNTKNPSYLNSVMTFLIDRYRWRCVSLSDVDKGLFALVNTRIAQELSESVDSILNDVDLSMYEKVYCYVGNIIYNFKYDGDDSMISCIQEVDDSKIIVDGLEYYWSVNLGLFATRNQGGKEVVEEAEEISKNSDVSIKETKINLESDDKLGSGYLENMKNANKKIDEMYEGWNNSNGAFIEVNNEDEVDEDMSSTNYFN